MFITFQPSEINCLHAFNNSSEAAPRRAGLSPIDQIKQKHQNKQLIKLLHHGQVSKNIPVEHPAAKTHADLVTKSGFRLDRYVADNLPTSTNGSGRNLSVDKEKKTHNGFGRKLDGNGFAKEVHTKFSTKWTRNGHGQGRTENNSVTKSMHTKCSTKWTRDENGRTLVEEMANGSASGLAENVHTKCSMKWVRDGRKLVEEIENGSTNGLAKNMHTKCSTQWVRDGTKLVEGIEDSSISGSTKSVHTKRSTKWVRNDNGSKAVDKIENHLTVGLAKHMHMECSAKWSRYGGSLPAMLEALDKIADVDKALKPWEMNLSNKEVSILLKEQVLWERAVEVFVWFKRKRCYELNVIHYNIMIKILGRSRRWHELESLWGEMRKSGIEPVNSTYGTFIDVYRKGGLREKAMQWLELMNERKMMPDEVTMSIVVQMYKEAGDCKSAAEFYQKWSSSKVISSSRMPGMKGVVPCESVLNVYTYNTLIDTYGKTGKLEEAGETFQKMIKRGVMPTTVTFNSLIHMYGNNGQLGKVTSLMQTMEKIKCSPDTRTYNILISVHAKHGNIESAARYFKLMKDAFLEPDAVTYKTLLYAFSIRHMVTEAEELVKEMDERKFDIDEYTQSSLTRMYIEAGLLDKSWAWFERFHLGGSMTSECYSANLDAFGVHGHILEAEKVFYLCREVKKLDVVVFNVMIKAYGIGKKFEQACHLFHEMKMYSILPDKVSYNSLVQMLASADLPQQGLIYLRKMQEVGLVNDSLPYSAVMSSYTRLGQLEMAVELYEEMIANGIRPDVVVYGLLINAFAEWGSVKEATFYLNAMINMGLPMNDVVCNSLIKLYTKVGYLKEAQEAYKSLNSFQLGSHYVYSSNCMIDLYCERSMVVEAEEIFEDMKRKGVANEFTYAMMLCMYKRTGRYVEAFWISRKMRELGFMTDLLSYNNILGLYASDGRYKEAAVTFTEMQKSGVHPDDCTFKSLGSILLKCGVPKDSIDKLELIRKEDMQRGIQAWSSTLTSVIDVDDEIDNPVD